MDRPPTHDQLARACEEWVSQTQRTGVTDERLAELALYISSLARQYDQRRRVQARMATGLKMLGSFGLGMLVAWLLFA